LFASSTFEFLSDVSGIPGKSVFLDLYFHFKVQHCAVGCSMLAQTFAVFRYFLLLHIHVKAFLRTSQVVGMKVLERPLEKLDEVRKKKLIELCGVENSAPATAAPGWCFSCFAGSLQLVLVMWFRS